jgi:hypothetical protein
LTHDQASSGKPQFQAEASASTILAFGAGPALLEINQARFCCAAGGSPVTARVMPLRHGPLLPALKLDRDEHREVCFKHLDQALGVAEESGKENLLLACSAASAVASVRCLARSVRSPIRTLIDTRSFRDCPKSRLWHHAKREGTTTTK